jgi:hypothetical protein
MLGALAGGKQVFGSNPGDRCNQTEDLFTCKWGGVCIGSTCYQSCSEDSDCPSEWHCGITEVTFETQRMLSSDKRDGTKSICFAPKDTAKKE